MLRLLQYIICGHVHEWETIAKCPLSNDWGASGTRYHQQCKKCGIVKKRDLI